MKIEMEYQYKSWHRLEKLVLSENNFSNKFTGYRHSLVREFSECLAVLCLPVTHLDLSGGCLSTCTSDDKILRSLCEMDNLRSLDISHNRLSDKEFRTILSRYRVFRIGFRVLESLDMSGNTVSLKTLKCVLRFPRLRTLRASIASSLIQRDSGFVKHWCECMSVWGFHEDTHACTHPLTQIRTEGFGAVIVHEWERKVIELETKRKKKIERRRSIDSCGNFYGVRAAVWSRPTGSSGPNIPSRLSPHSGGQPTGSSGFCFVLQSETEQHNKNINLKPDEETNYLEIYDTHTYKKIDRVNNDEQRKNMNEKQVKNKEQNLEEQENLNARRLKIEHNLNEHRPSERQQEEHNKMSRQIEETLSMNKEKEVRKNETENFNEHRLNKMQEQKNMNKRKNTEQSNMNIKRQEMLHNMNRTRHKNIEEHGLKGEQEEMTLNEELALFKKFYLN